MKHLTSIPFYAMADEGAAGAASEAPTSRKLIIGGVEFTASLPYKAGHVLTDAEARALNQTRTENLRNNFAPKVKASTEKAEGSLQGQALIDAFVKADTEYSFSMPGAGGGTRTLDPIEREARNIAKAIIVEKLKAQGKSITPPKEASDEQKAAYKAAIDAKIDELAQRENIVKAARKEVESRGKSLAALAESFEL